MLGLVLAVLSSFPGVGCGDSGAEAAADCSDGVVNGDETDIDCGGGCAPCGVGQACESYRDCAGGVCAGGVCGTGVHDAGVDDAGVDDAGSDDAGIDDVGLDAGGDSGPQATCDDRIRNQDETGIDCGGAECPSCDEGYVPPVVPNATRFNRDYYDEMIAQGKPTQESPWGFQEISTETVATHDVSSIVEFQDLVEAEAGTVDGSFVWHDGATHFINFAAGVYPLQDPLTYYVMRIPSRTIVQGAGIGETVFVASEATPLDRNYVRVFSIERSDDVVLRDFSFHNETSTTRWTLIYSADHADGAVRENFLFENIEFDDSFGAIGSSSGSGTGGGDFSFITLRGLRKRIGHTSAMIRDNYAVPVPTNYQFLDQNSDGVHLAGQVGVRRGNSVVIHDCVLGDNISATLDTYTNYIEIVGTRFVDPLHDHSIKSPNGNHLYVHHSAFELQYTERLIRGGAYWLPTFYTHEGGTLTNYHFRELRFERAGVIFEDGVALPEGEVFQIYGNRPTNVAGDMVWEAISFSGYDNTIVGFPNVQTDLGFQAINYTSFEGRPAQSKLIEDRGNPDFSVAIDRRTGSSRQDLVGVYSWGARLDGTIDYPRDNRAFRGTKSETESRPYVEMRNASVRTFYNAALRR